MCRSLRTRVLSFARWFYIQKQCKILLECFLRELVAAFGLFDFKDGSLHEISAANNDRGFADFGILFINENIGFY